MKTRTLFFAALAPMLVLISGNANANNYDLTFSDGYSATIFYRPAWPLPYAFEKIEVSQNFTPITLFDGDTLNIQFLNVPDLIPSLAPSYTYSSFTWGKYITTLYANGARAQIEESGFGPSNVMVDEYYYTPADFYSGEQLGFPDFSSTWSIMFTLLSGEPQGSAGLIVDSIDVTLINGPLPATLPLFASGLGALGLLAWRRKRKPAE